MHLGYLKFRLRWLSCYTKGNYVEWGFYDFWVVETVATSSEVSHQAVLGEEAIALRGFILSAEILEKYHIAD